MPVRHILRSSALLLVCIAPHRSVAQSTTTLLPDATVLPRGTFRFRGLVAWTRYDALFSADSGSPRNLGARFASDSLGVREIPSLASSEAAVRTLSGIPNFRLTAGQLVSAANSRVVTAPLIVEYGLTSRLSLGVVVPLVETRTTLYSQLNPRPGMANVGPNPALTNPGALASNAAFVQSLTNAAAALQTRLTACQTTPTGAGCATLLAQQAEATSLIQSSGAFAAAVTQQYGTDAGAHPGRAFVPLATDPAQVAINAKIAAFKQQYQSFLNSDVVNGNLAAAGGPAARAQMQALLASFGYDSLRSRDRASIGDISLGASLQLVNSFGDTTASTLRYRLTVNGAFRIGTGEPAARNQLFDVATGYGQPGVEGSVATDIQLKGRLMLSGVGSYTAQLGTVVVPRVANSANAIFPLANPFAGTYSAGNVMTLTLIPRWRLAGSFALNGFYSIVHTASDQYTLTATTPGGGSATGEADVPPVAPFGLPSTTAQQVGIGFSYSSVVSPDRGPGRIPFEVSFSHLETLSGSGGPTPKTFRDQIELRVYVVR